MLSIIHLTDSHLFAESGDTLKGVNSRSSLRSVFDMIRQRDSAADLMILGGDISQDGSTGSYEHIAEQLTSLSIPHSWVPGNHDHPDRMEQQLGMQPLSMVRSGWQIIHLSTWVSGLIGGMLSNDELEMLDKELGLGSRYHQLIVMHHQPVAIGSLWLDEIGLINRDSFWRIVDRHPNVKGVLFGHVHQQFDAGRRTIRLMGTPATSIQFRPGRPEFGLDDISPGYRWLRLQRNGNIETGIRRIDGFIPQDLSDTTSY